MRRLAFQIRRAEAQDGIEIVSCLQSAFAEYRDRYTPAAFADTVLDGEGVSRRLEQMSLFVAVSDGQIVGTIGCRVNGERGHLRGMAVSPDRQGEGVASALLRTVEAELLDRGCKYVTLNTTEPLTRAVRFYTRHGYCATGRVSDFFGMRLYEYSKSLL